jgi:tetratricopeptide (TPR) repeat protein
VQNCTKLIVSIQQIATQNPREREKLLKEYVKAFTSHIRNNERNAAAYLGRGLCLIMLGDYEASVKDINQTILLKENSPVPISQLYLLRAEVAIEYAQYREAILDLNKVDPVDHLIWFGKIHRDVGNFHRALAIFDKIITNSEELSYSWESYILAHAFKADILSQQGDIAKAIYHAQEAVNCVPYLGGAAFMSVTASTVYTIQGLVSSRSKNYSRGLEQFEIALRWVSGNESVFSYRGKLYAQMGQYQKAWRDHQMALSSAVNSHIVQYNVACYYAIQGKNTQAIQYLKAALEKGYSNFTAIKRDPDMKELIKNPEVQKLLAEYKEKKAHLQKLP